MTKLAKRISAAAAAIVMITAVITPASAAECSPHHPGNHVDTYLFTKPVATHQHLYAIFPDGSKMYKTCQISLKIYDRAWYCLDCDKLIKTETTSEEIHSV